MITNGEIGHAKPEQHRSRILRTIVIFSTAMSITTVGAGTADLSPAPPTATVDGLVVIVRRGALASASLAALADDSF